MLASGRRSCSPDQRVWIVLHHHDANDQRRFSDPARVWTTSTFRSGLPVEAWRDWSSAQGVEHAPTTYLDQFDMSALVYRDPVNLQLELITYGSAPDRDGGGRPSEPCEPA